MEAIIILFAYNLCLGLLSSVIVLTSGAPQTVEPVRIKSQSVTITAQLVQSVSEYEAEAEEIAYYEEAEEADYAESVYDEAQGCFAAGFDSSFKSYMDYNCISNTASVQYSMQQQAYTDERGFRKIGDDYCVALGSGFTNGCGERFLITLDSGYSFTAIVSDVKDNAHTDSTNRYNPRGENSGNVVEFIIDTCNADSLMLTSGSAGCYEDLSGNIISVQKI